MRRVETPPQRIVFQDGWQWPWMFEWEGGRHEVRTMLETWVLETKCWRPEGSERRTFYRVVVTGSKGPNLICVLAHNENSERAEWTLEKIED